MSRCIEIVQVPPPHPNPRFAALGKSQWLPCAYEALWDGRCYHHDKAYRLGLAKPEPTDDDREQLERLLAEWDIGADWLTAEKLSVRSGKGREESLARRA